MSALLKIGIGFGAFGLLFVSIGAGLVLSEWRFGQHAERAQGTLVGLRMVGGSAGPGTGSFYYLPTVRFRTGDGQEIEAESRLGSNPPPGRPGDVVALRFDPRRPERFRLDRVDLIGNFVAIGCIFMGLLPLVVGICLVKAA